MLVAEQEVVFNSLDWFSMPKTQKWGRGESYGGDVTGYREVWVKSTE